MPKLDRREFLKIIGGTAIGSAASVFLTSCQRPGLEFSPLKRDWSFDAIQPVKSDELVLPPGFSYEILRAYGDDLGSANRPYGFNNDFTCFFPLAKKDQALLWVNHESIDPKYVAGEDKQRKMVGGSIFKIFEDESGWHYDAADTSYNRRVDANTPMMITGPLQKKIDEVRGTLANCGGGRTPWGTVLTCEENYHHFDKKYHWKNFKRKHYGWVVEVNPYDSSFKPRKHTALGRFSHENTAIVISGSGKVVIYMGDDKEDEYIYKFVSSRSFIKPHSQVELHEYSSVAEGFSNLLTEGDLYVARLYDPNTGKTIRPSLDKSDKGIGEWKLLSLKDRHLAKKFRSQEDILVHCRKAGKTLHASKLDRPEDLEVSPYDASIYVSLTKNSKRDNNFGSILRLIENNNDHEATHFSWSNFLVAGDDFGMACPDNLAFDNRGNLWVCTDGSVDDLEPERAKLFGNNALFVVPLAGRNAGIPKRFASAPNGAELTGPYFSDDYSTLFLSVQHPGEDGVKSHWPHGNPKDFPRPATVAIKLER